MPEFSHIDKSGHAQMVDVTDKSVTVRTASAVGKVLLSEKVVSALKDNNVPKGDVLSTARIAGIMATKKTSELVPLCHPIAIHGVNVELTVINDGVSIEATVKTSDRTGVEMEALTAVSVAALTVIDMVKALDPMATISEIYMTEKDGGQNGHWVRPN